MKFLNAAIRAQIESQTPSYIYDQATLLRDLSSLRSALPENFEIFYSMKSNPHPKVLKKLREARCRIDVASLGELEAAERAGFPMSHVSYVGPGKREVELAAIVSRGVGFPVVESIEELRRLEYHSAQEKRQTPVCLRINPFPELSYQFGIDLEQREQVFQTLRACPHLELVGTHFYIRSHYLDARQILDNFRKFYKISIELESAYGKPLRAVNFGGGFGIPYFEGQRPLDLAELGAGLKKLSAEFSGHGLASCRFFVESGRFLSARCGVFVVKILYRKVSHGRVFLICDGGMSTHQAATGVGQLIRRNYEISLWPRSIQTVNELETVTLAGPSCYALDILATDVRLPRAEAGDLICIWNSGAYGITFSPENFLSLPRANEFYLANGVLEGESP